jgi:hypothetical protein
MPNVLENLKRLMAEYDASREGDKPFGYNIFPYVRALMNSAHSLIAAAEKVQAVDQAILQIEDDWHGTTPIAELEKHWPAMKRLGDTRVELHAALRSAPLMRTGDKGQDGAPDSIVSASNGA